MTRYMIASLSLTLLLATPSFAQSGSIIPEHGAGHADKPSCVVLKRMGPADQVTSHLYSFGIRGKQFQYVEGKLPDGFPFHGRLTDHDVRNLQSRGAEVIVLNQNYTPDELKQARTDCQGITGKTPLQEEAKATSSPAQPTTASASPTSGATSAGANELSISSTPPGADIEVDGKFVGNTPSSVTLAPGDHDIAVKKGGFAAGIERSRSQADTSPSMPTFLPRQSRYLAARE
jgi:hypothetical protein